ncbi:MAG: RNA polymerase factor sigma-54 [Alphaproteobacteria bacterium]|nr:RNA polymerase factor sigma-54 [Alphaproteobacteria bacterium]
MALSQRLDLRQSQSLVMTPQLQQAIKLLQFSNNELSEFIDEELEKNPLLERDEGEGSVTQEAAEDNISAYESAQALETVQSSGSDVFDEEVTTDTLSQTASEKLPEQNDDPNDIDYENNWSSASADRTDNSDSFSTPSMGASLTNSGGNSNFDATEFNIDETASASKTLRQHLYDQLGLDLSDPQERLIGAHLIEMVDETGYFLGDSSDIADILNCSQTQIDDTLEKLQHFEPAGVFARNLSECLRFQLRDKNRLDPAMDALLENLELLAQHKINDLKKLCNVDDEDIAEMVLEIRALDPKPGLIFELNIEQAIAPDVLLKATPDGSWLVELNPDNLPRVLINNTYYANVSKKHLPKSDKDFLNDCAQSANWLVKSLHQRATTIIKVASEIVLQQDAFFRFGVQHLKPLVLRDVAEAISMHESTISRVTNNKYISTPRGMLELKYFFTSSIASAGGGEAYSAEAVKFKIKSLIDEEVAGKILSDDKIVEILQNLGMDIARRTVAKYRDALKIPSSVQRRRQKAF